MVILHRRQSGIVNPGSSRHIAAPSCAMRLAALYLKRGAGGCSHSAQSASVVELPLMTEPDASREKSLVESRPEATVTLVFSVMNAVLLHPLGPVDGKGLVIVYATAPNGETDYPGQGDFFDWRDQTRSFTNLVGWRGQVFLSIALHP
jgi:hypothetical protein